MGLVWLTVVWEVSNWTALFSSHWGGFCSYPGDGGDGGDRVYGRLPPDVREQQASVADGVAVCHARNSMGACTVGENVRAGEEQRGSRTFG